ncbi:MAG TPA: hypothetical protein DEF51_00520 [Myxococcales bacterium]|nr:hypothetical protein [Myxococcales bacterium]
MAAARRPGPAPRLPLAAPRAHAARDGAIRHRVACVRDRRARGRRAARVRRRRMRRSRGLPGARPPPLRLRSHGP